MREVTIVVWWLIRWRRVTRIERAATYRHLQGNLLPYPATLQARMGTVIDPDAVLQNMHS